MKNLTYQDPTPLVYENISLPPSIIDTQSLWTPIFLFRFIKKNLGFDLGKITLPKEITAQYNIPSYALLEFHNLPNGYYSKFISNGYLKGFDVAMIGEMKRIRRELASEFLGFQSVLDLGCGGGISSQALHDFGIPNVWGLDPSPYLLVVATRRFGNVNFVQGSAEKTGFSDQRFDGISACWVFHEIPPRYADLALIECSRILKPGGKLVIVEPSKLQLQGRPFELFKKFGLKGVYFSWLSKFVFEPYVKAWHARDIKQWLTSHGFELLENKLGMPDHKIVAQKI